MGSTCKLQFLALFVLVSFLSLGVSVLLLLATGSWQKGERQEIHVYQQLTQNNQLELQPPMALAHVPSNDMRSPQHRPAADIRSNEDQIAANEPRKRQKRLSKKRLKTIKTSLYNSTNTEDQNTTGHIVKQELRHNRMLPTAAQSPLNLVPSEEPHPISSHDLCPDPASLCTHFLPLEQLSLYKECAAKTMAKLETQYQCHCQFMNSTGHWRVALVSLPGSGNTWLRGLLERVSGVCTGSLFCDKTLHAGGMCGEGLREGVLAVKIHDTKLQWTQVPYKDGTWSDKRPFFDAAVLLVRSPFKALVAEWNRQNAYKFASSQPGSSHVKYLESSEYFLENEKWKEFVSEGLRRWKMMISENLLRNRAHPVTVVFYEKLKSSDLLMEVERVLDFLQFPYSADRVKSAVEDGFSSYYRNHTDSYQHFTAQQADTVNAAIVGTVARLRARNLTDIANHIDTYQSANF